MTIKGLLRTCNPSFLHCFPPHQSLNAMNKSQAKGWPHLENIHRQGHYIPRQVAHSFHLRPHLNTDPFLLVEAKSDLRSFNQHSKLLSNLPHLRAFVYAALATRNTLPPSLQMARSLFILPFQMSLLQRGLLYHSSLYPTQLPSIIVFCVLFLQHKSLFHCVLNLVESLRGHKSHRHSDFAFIIHHFVHRYCNCTTVITLVYDRHYSIC